MALKYVQRQCLQSGAIPNHTWVLDSIPRPYQENLEASQKGQSVFNVFELLSNLPTEFSSREWIVDEMIRRGLDKPVALWLATNIIVAPGGGFRWGFDVAVLRALFDDFCQCDMWSFLENFKGDGSIHFVRAGKNPSWTPDILAAFDALTRENTRIKLHTMPHVGHWLHTEDLDGLFKIISSESGIEEHLH